ncbi:MAG TPA: bifunctional nuclease family protein [Candidatus Omnitrophota bacterium]|nr:bifunctional nuclease family protein [Candidatus Omnitrophota bacterium]
MVEMELKKIIIDEKRQDQIIVLKEKAGERLLPIIIGFLEASAIKMKIAGAVPPRPLTHDLLKTVIEALDAQVNRVIIDKLEDSTFHAKIVISPKGSDKERIVDARPSDSIALAVRVKAPIFVEEEVIKRSQVFQQGQ